MLPMANEMDLERHKLALRQQGAELASTKEVLADLLDNHVADTVTGSVSTLVTWGAAGAMGAVDGALGPRRFIGPVPVSAILGVGAAVGAAVLGGTGSPNACEALNATARGLGAPAIYEMTFRASQNYWNPAWQARIDQANAANAADAASGKGGGGTPTGTPAK